MRSARDGRSGNLGAAVFVGVLALMLANSGKHAATVKHPPAGRSHAYTVSVTSGDETAFIRAVLGDLGAPATDANIRSLASWFPREYPSWPPLAANNPMSSTLWAQGATVYNTLRGGGHVWNYPTATEGAHATALTLANGYYPQIVSALRSGAGLCGNSSLAGEFLTWSGGGYSGVC